jgi:DNA-binding beta-propeller fold protein YncE
MTHARKVHFVTWLAAALVVVNFLLAISFFVILFAGAITDGFTRYIAERHLYAPPLVGLLATGSPFVWTIVKWLIGVLAPAEDAQKKLLRSFFSKFQIEIGLRLLAAQIGCVVMLGLASTQLWAIDNVCAPKPMDGSYGTAGLALSPDEGRVFLADAQSSGAITIFAASKSGAINHIDDSYWSIGNITTGPSPKGIVRTRDGHFVYVVNGGNGTVSIIDLRDPRQAMPPIKVGDHPRWIAAAPDGEHLYVSNEYFDALPARTGSISIIDARTQTVAGEIKDVNCPEGLAVSPAGDKLYVASQCGQGNDPLFIIDTKSNRKIDEVPGLAVGNAVITSKDGKKIYVTRANFKWYDRGAGTIGAPLSIVDAETRRVLKTLILQVSADGLALTPDGRYVLVTNGYQLSVVDTQNDELVSKFSLRGYGGAVTVRTDNVVIVAVSDSRRLVTFPLASALSHWPCASL